MPEWRKGLANERQAERPASGQTLLSAGSLRLGFLPSVHQLAGK
jgi:hypothetical protein